MESEHVTVAQAAKLLCITPQTVRSWLKRAQIQTIQGPRGTLIHLHDVDEKLVKFRRFSETVEVLSALRRAYKTASSYMASGGVYNLEPERAELEALWREGLKGGPVEYENAVALVRRVADVSGSEARL